MPWSACSPTRYRRGVIPPSLSASRPSLFDWFHQELVPSTRILIFTTPCVDPLFRTIPCSLWCLRQSKSSGRAPSANNSPTVTPFVDYRKHLSDDGDESDQYASRSVCRYSIFSYRHVDRRCRPPQGLVDSSITARDSRHLGLCFPKLRAGGFAWPTLVLAAFAGLYA